MRILLVELQAVMILYLKLEATWVTPPGPLEASSNNAFSFAINLLLLLAVVQCRQAAMM